MVAEILPNGTKYTHKLSQSNSYNTWKIHDYEIGNNYFVYTNAVRLYGVINVGIPKSSKRTVETVLYNEKFFAQLDGLLTKGWKLL